MTPSDRLAPQPWMIAPETVALVAALTAEAIRRLGAFRILPLIGGSADFRKIE